MGIEAASATSLIRNGCFMGRFVKRLDFRVDHPFYLFVIHSEQPSKAEIVNKVLFMGKINNIT